MPDAATRGVGPAAQLIRGLTGNINMSSALKNSRGRSQWSNAGPLSCRLNHAMKIATMKTERLLPQHCSAVAYEIGQRAQALGLNWTQVREWLRQLHIDGWIREFDATSREVDDLAEFCRTPANSPIRQLLEDHVTTVDLTYPMTPPPNRPLAVELRTGGSADPVEVWTLSDPSYSVGTVAAAFHTDMQLLSNSGIEYSVTTDGGTLTLRETR